MAITHSYVDYGAGNDYKGASFTDGSFANATLTLTKAGAFTATKVNHWLYLDDNGSGEVTTGYYRVTDITGAPNAVVLDADIRSGANDPTDVVCTQHDGTTSLPWRSLQGAFDLLTRNTTDGNQVNLKAGTAHVNAAALDLTTFIAGGALSGAGNLIVRGYTTAANDGGIGEIDCNGATMWAATTYDYVVLVDLEIHSGGDNNLIDMDQSCCLYHCEVHKGASSPSGKRLINLGINGEVVGCYLHDLGAGGSFGMIGNTSFYAYSNYIDMGETGANSEAIRGARRSALFGNIVLVSSSVNTSQIGISALESLIVGNIVYSTIAATNNAISSEGVGTIGGSVTLNNIVVGFSGSGGVGIKCDAGIIGYNAFYNNATNNSLVDVVWDDQTSNDVALAADPFTSASTGDFSLTAAAKTALAAKGFPLAYLGAHANTVPNLNIGPIQMAAGGAAGGGFPILGGSVVR